jgi:preprotein translocase subunit YajC
MVDTSWLLHASLWAQGATGEGRTASVPKEAAPKEGSPQGPGGGLLDFGLLLPLLIIGALFYLMLMRPERRKRQDMQKLLDELKENDRVVTIGGIIGTIVGFGKTKDEVILRIDEKTNTRIRVLRTAISRPLKVEDDAASEKKELSKDL